MLLVEFADRNFKHAQLKHCVVISVEILHASLLEKRITNQAKTFVHFALIRAAPKQQYVFTAVAHLEENNAKLMVANNELKLENFAIFIMQDGKRVQI